jgi:hypothetical protein
MGLKVVIDVMASFVRHDERDGCAAGKLTADNYHFVKSGFSLRLLKTVMGLAQG